MSTSTWWAWKHVAGFLHVHVKFFSPFFRMVDTCNVANNSPIACDCVVETRSGQRSSEVGVAIPPEYSLHEKA